MSLLLGKYTRTYIRAHDVFFCFSEQAAGKQLVPVPYFLLCQHIRYPPPQTPDKGHHAVWGHAPTMPDSCCDVRGMPTYVSHKITPPPFYCQFSQSLRGSMGAAVVCVPVPSRPYNLHVIGGTALSSRSIETYISMRSCNLLLALGIHQTFA